MINLANYAPRFGSAAEFVGIPILNLHEVRQRGYNGRGGFRIRYYKDKRETAKVLANSFRVYPKTK